MPQNRIENLVAYIALGDSISINLYPALDLHEPEDAPLGAAALLYQNHDRIWPQFKGRDLKSLNPKLQFANLCEDGATTWDLLQPDAFALIEKFRNEPVLITITTGGNDLLGIVRQDVADLMGPLSEIETRIQTIMKNIVERFPRATIIINSIYDPTDGSGQMPMMPDLREKLPFLRYLNHSIEKIATAHGALFGDIHAKCQGHGIGKPDCYFWEPSPIEPSALGASAVRELWLEVLAKDKVI